MTAADKNIDLAIEKLRRLSVAIGQSNWRYQSADLPLADIWQPDKWENWPVVELNAKNHISWSAGEQVLWLVQKFVVPEHLAGYPLKGLALRLSLSWWAVDVQIFVNGELVQSGDLFDYFTRILLSSSVTAGDEIAVALRLVSPSHDRGALVRSDCIYESPDDNCLEPSFVADELDVLQRFLAAFAPDKLDYLVEAVADIDWSVVSDKEKFDISLCVLRQNLLSQIPNLASKIYLLGHAHLDMAWLWPVSETWIAAQRTFASVLKLQADFPDLIFCHSTPALYRWIELHRPDLFAAIQKQVKVGRWEVVGGMWVEPDLNLIDGESIVRQILYGQRYVQAKFDRLSTVAWLPDSFGFCATLPQFLKAGGIEYFVTQKLTWNDTNKFPHGAFWWQSPDGSQIFSFMSALIGESIDPIKMANYVVDWETKTKLKDALWLPGVGDHGGGPTRDMLEVAQRWEKSPFFPELEFTTSRDYLQKVEERIGDKKNIPVWQDEIYLEFHRGCYTTHADQKRWNRRCERLLYEAELFASLANIIAKLDYPKMELENAWKQVLFNQFHDILPGTSIREVFLEANRAWQEVERVGEEISQTAMSAIASRISLPPPPHPDALPIVVFNSLNWQRSEVVSLPLPSSPTSWQICHENGNPVPSQCVTPLAFGEIYPTPTLLFVANDVPSVGYRLFWLVPQSAETIENTLAELESPYILPHLSHHTKSILAKKGKFVKKVSLTAKDSILENEFLRVTIDPETGDIASIFDKENDREILDKPTGNQLQAFQDSGQYWDAWNIDPNYQQHPLPATELKSIDWVYLGEVQQRLRVVRKLGKSEFYQDYVLDARSPILKIITTADWQESHVLVKAAFQFNLTADFVNCEIPCGVIQRPTRPQQPTEKAKWEIPILRWVDLSAENYGVSLLNDCKYGCDAQPNQLRLTLLRSPNWPDPEADKGYHQFTYAIYPHTGNWQSAQTVRRGYELNLPMQAMVVRSPAENINPQLPPVGSWLNLESENLISIAFKQSEDNPQQWILRCYECHGQPTKLKLESDLGLKITEAVDLLERPVEMPERLPDDRSLQISPWKIISFKVINETKI